MHTTNHLDKVFAALSHEVRRGILSCVLKEDMRVTELAERFDCSLNGTSKHIRVLEEAGLVLRVRRGRDHWIQFHGTPLEQAEAWMGNYTNFWQQWLKVAGETPQLSVA